VANAVEEVDDQPERHPPEEPPPRLEREVTHQVPEWAPAPLVFEAYIDECGVVQVLSMDPEPEPPLPAMDTPGPLLLAERDTVEEHRKARLKALMKRESELIGRADPDALAATRLQIGQVEAECALVKDG